MHSLFHVKANDDRFNSSTGSILEEGDWSFLETIKDLRKSCSDLDVMESHRRSSSRRGVRALCRILSIDTSDSESDGTENTRTKVSSCAAIASDDDKDSCGHSNSSGNADSASSKSRSKSTNGSAECSRVEQGEDTCETSQQKESAVEAEAQTGSRALLNQLFQGTVGNPTRETKRRKSHGSIDELLTGKTKPSLKRRGSCRDINNIASFGRVDRIDDAGSTPARVDRAVDAGSTPVRSSKRTSIRRPLRSKDILELANSFSDSDTDTDDDTDSDVDSELDANVDVGAKQVLSRERSNRELSSSPPKRDSMRSNARRPSRTRSIALEKGAGKQRPEQIQQRRRSTKPLNLGSPKDKTNPPFGRSATAPCSSDRWSSNPSNCSQQPQRSSSEDIGVELKHQRQSDKINVKALMASYDWKTLSESNDVTAKTRQERRPVKRSSSTPNLQNGKQKRDGSRASFVIGNRSARKSRRTSSRRSTVESQSSRSASPTTMMKPKSRAYVQQRRSSEKDLLAIVPKPKRSSSAPSLLDVSTEDQDQDLSLEQLLSEPQPLRRKSSSSGHLNVGGGSRQQRRLRFVKAHRAAEGNTIWRSSSDRSLTSKKKTKVKSNAKDSKGLPNPSTKDSNGKTSASDKVRRSSEVTEFTTNRANRLLELRKNWKEASRLVDSQPPPQVQLNATGKRISVGPMIG
ncbi:expressed unknown protein [Seminavis robusta]|uniref:Uncharacterized protein n=1 Tax=Seminavis robusta TaxID=568900 RepID=A0A9N8H7H4_9STRA|nr:expressed unknown protein [Seminavis robusta]|eukprot:Sro179_g078450.1 n/a (688) ;mRNA; f:31239-33302